MNREDNTQGGTMVKPTAKDQRTAPAQWRSRQATNLPERFDSVTRPRPVRARYISLRRKHGSH